VIYLIPTRLVNRWEDVPPVTLKKKIMEDIDLIKYIYWEYTAGVLIVTEVLKYFIKKIDTKFAQYIAVTEPKWITLFAAVLLLIADYFLVSRGDSFNLYQALISFGVAVFGYDYFINPIKYQFRKGVNETPEPK
jgi:hypothetical protein